MAEVVYNVGKARIAKALSDLDGGTLKAAFITGTKTGADNPDLATMSAIDAVTGVGLSTERVALTSLTVTQDDTNNRANCDVANFSFAAAAGVTALALVIYDATTDTDDTTRVPLAFYDTGFGTGLPVDGGLNVTVNDWLRLT